jgi:flagellar basal-body rod protein FlgB
MTPSNVTDTLYSQLHFRGEKQKVISSNIANINTPKYKTKELTFEHHLQKSSNDLVLKTTHSNHIAFDVDAHPENKPQIKEVQGLTEQNDGNNVNLDDQMSEMSKNNILFNAIQSSIKKDSLWLKEIINASSKN